MLARDPEETEADYESRCWLKFGKSAMHYAFEVLGPKSSLTPARLLEHWASTTPTRAAILSPEGTYTYAEFNARANQVASVLRCAGAREGDSMALMMDSRPEFLFALFGAAKIGVACGLINTNLAGEQLAHALRICKSTWCIVGEEHLAAIVALGDTCCIPGDRVWAWGDHAIEWGHERLTPFDATRAASPDSNLDNSRSAVGGPGAPFVYICTSGTTGLPKAALVSNQRYLQGVYYYGQAVVAANGSDVCYTSGLPLYHNVGLSHGFGIALSGGGAVALRRKFSASSFWSDCRQFGVTMFAYVGEVCRYLYAAPPHPDEHAHTLRCIVGAGLRPDMWGGFVERFGIARAYEYYGATEGNVGLINLTSKPGMVGKISPELGQVIVRVDPDTEEFVRENGKLLVVEEGSSGMLIAKIGPMAGFAGYVDTSKNSSKVISNPFGDGEQYFITGDLLTLHERNWVSFTDRLGDTFRWRGENVSTNEVQDALANAHGVRDIAVYGVEITGEEGRAGMAALVVEPDFDIEAFGAFASTVLPPYARPLFVRIDDQLPMTGSYKYVKTALKRDGFDPRSSAKAVYWWNTSAHPARLEPLDVSTFESLQRRGFGRVDQPGIVHDRPVPPSPQ